MKRFVSVILVIITLSLCILPCNAETISVISEDDYIYVSGHAPLWRGGLLAFRSASYVQ